MKVVAESHVKFIESAEGDFRAEDDAATSERRTATPARPAAPAETPRPKTLFEKPKAPAPAPEPAPAPRAAAPPRPAPPAAPAKPTEPAATARDAESDNDEIAGIGDILERLSQSQRETLSPQPLETESTFAPEHTPASIPPRSPEPVDHTDSSESEWNIEQIRRDLQRLASGQRRPDGPNAS
jgi:hypothetical protein